MELKSQMKALNYTKRLLTGDTDRMLPWQEEPQKPAFSQQNRRTVPLPRSTPEQQGVSSAQLEQLVGILGLEDRLGHLPHQLSGGQQQRVSIGRAVIANPALMLADEPTGNLDSRSSAQVMALLRYFHQKKGQTLIMITHDERIARQADRLITIEDGKIARDEAVRS